MATENQNTHQTARICGADVRSITLLLSMLAALLVSETNARPAVDAAEADVSAAELFIPTSTREF